MEDEFEIKGSSDDQNEALEMVAFDPTRQHLDLTKDEKLRTTALMLAIKQYTDFICKDADMYKEIMMRNGSMKPATVSGVVSMAIEFEAFLLGRYSAGNRPAIEDEDDEGLRQQSEDQSREPL